MLTFFYIVSLLLLRSQYVTCACYDEYVTLLGHPALGPSDVQFVSCSSGADSPKVVPYNLTSFDWWYFDAVSEDGTEEVVVVFYSASEASFPFDLDIKSDLSVMVQGTWEGGTSSLLYSSFADEATVTTVGDGSNGNWTNAGGYWTSTSDLSQYSISIETDNVFGTFVLESVAPGHYPCGPLEVGQNEEILPGIGWVNVVPDAQGTVNMTIDGKLLSFTGYGYHDKNWSNQPFADAVKSWYWGHGRLGPYSVVWYDAIAADGTEYVSGYAVQNGQVVSSTCSGVKVRPIGVNSEYPPQPSIGSPGGFNIELPLESGDVLSFNTTSPTVVLDAVVYFRWISQLVGGINGAADLTGSALFEQFAF